MAVRTRKAGVSKVVLYRIDPDTPLDDALAEYLRAGSGTRGDWDFEVYTRSKRDKPPAWRELVIGVVDDEAAIPTNSYASLVLLFTRDDRTYALTAGYGYGAVSKCALQDFGVEIAKKALDPNELARLFQKVPTGNVYGLDRVLRGKYMPENDQVNRKSVLKALRGKCVDKGLGLSLEGRTSLSVAGKKDLDDVVALLDRVVELEDSDDYTVAIRGLDETPKRLCQVLDDVLRERIGAGFVQDIMLGYDDDSIASRCELVRVGRGEVLLPFDDVDGILAAARVARPEDPTAARVCGYDEAEEEVFDTDLMRTLECELDHEGDKYFRISRKWYRTNPDYEQEINEEFAAIGRLDLDYLDGWPTADGKYVTEDDYLDTKVSPTVQLAHTRKIKTIELADLLDTQNRYLVHVKKGRGAFLRNLFAQGYVSASMLHGDDDFRAQAYEKFGIDDLGEYTVVMAVFPAGAAGDPGTVFTLFAKVDLVERCHALQAIGFDAKYAIISQDRI